MDNVVTHEVRHTADVVLVAALRTVPEEVLEVALHNALVVEEVDRSLAGLRNCRQSSESVPDR